MYELFFLRVFFADNQNKKEEAQGLVIPAPVELLQPEV
jgi:hypothetical protein